MPVRVGNNGRWRPGEQRSLAAAVRRKSTPFHGADGAGALQGADRQCPFVLAMMVGGGLEGSGPSLPPCAVG